MPKNLILKPQIKMDFNYHQKIDNLYFMNESVEHPGLAINDPTSQETKVMIDQNYNKCSKKHKYRLT